MTQFKTKASPGVRLLKSTAASALALSALAAGVVLSGGEAKAVRCNFVASVFVDPCTDGLPGLGVWHDSNNAAALLAPSDKQIWYFNAPTGTAPTPANSVTGDVEWKWFDLNGNGTSGMPADWLFNPNVNPVADQWQVDVDLSPNFNLDNGGGWFPGTSTFDYAVKILYPPAYPSSPATVFADIQLDSDIVQGAGMNTTVQKRVWAGSLNPNGSPNCPNTGTPLVDLINPPSPSPNTPIWDLGILGQQVICVRDIVTIPANDNGANVDNYTNTFRQTPGPLPILGAGTALGFSRKLRKRVKAYRMI
jgi:hypothetical protein